ncbi:engulfment and motility protein [Stylonychia lemnae]|uniref:Engulfment and motility protein n=1 Tax=Stylonychia lemnae TaxID=5949 RepID=A0A078A395_STYLE|nr:engulfment and motility protein [Stylonychia lemnae]|eukprot:CDW75978.1 engulfment and motility protein [Stylonychia lemnae]
MDKKQSKKSQKNDEEKMNYNSDDDFNWDSHEDEENGEHNQLLQDFRKNQITAINGQKGLFEKLCKCCKSNQDLNSREEILKQFYIIAFKPNEDEIPPDLKSQNWSEIGFQSKNARTDFRGAGLLGLHCLRYFASVYPAEFAQMRNNTSSNFFIAITSLNITHMIIVYLYMNREEVQDRLKKLRAGRKQLKKFAFLNQKTKSTFFELNSFMLQYVYHLWIKESSEKAKVTRLPPDFQAILDKAKKQGLHHTLSNLENFINNLTLLRIRLNAIIREKFQKEFLSE